MTKKEEYHKFKTRYKKNQLLAQYCYSKFGNQPVIFNFKEWVGENKWATWLPWRYDKAKWNRNFVVFRCSLDKAKRFLAKDYRREYGKFWTDEIKIINRRFYVFATEM